MVISPKLKTAGILTGSLLVGSVYLNLRNKRRDKIATEFMIALKKEINPSTTGLLSSNAFDIDFKQEVLKETGRPIKVLSESAANKLAKQLNDSFSFWGDDEDKINSVFRGLKDQVQVSQVAKAYYEKYDVNLIDKFNSRLSKKEISAIMGIVKRLPEYSLV